MFTPQQSRKSGQTFVSGLILLTIFWVILYVVSHSMSDEQLNFTKINLSESYRLSPQGEFFLYDTVAINWAMGEANASPILKRLNERTNQIRLLMENLRLSSDQLAKSLGQESDITALSKNNPVTVIDDALAHSLCDQKKIRCAVWDQAKSSLQRLSEELASIKSFEESNNIMNKLLITLSDLQQKTYAQHLDANALRLSNARSFFWSSPAGSSIEIIFFAVFGVLANLLVTSAEYLRHNNFRPSERWVAYTKLVYGPILAWILVTAIAVGWFDLGEYEVGVYSLPLLAFILGFYSRKTVALFDKFGKKLLGEAGKSIEKGPAHIAARRRASFEQYLHSLHPRDCYQIKQAAFDIHKDIVKTIVFEKEANK
ncbi:hypothetical protein [Pseudoalteromonas aurantia]|uniref:Uncharacterized protein n=1 Tax=Pseudoalteromonas aurantia 208 TaxID=1314867 RepID=A0ABR9EDZ9_9GAMM|nr:hypothetical protein [Pseudoalteromonas aurantia]MBE0369052.1 hypothetical protein [Pseudoalteromonas aurantia 208]